MASRLLKYSICPCVHYAPHPRFTCLSPRCSAQVDAGPDPSHTPICIPFPSALSLEPAKPCLEIVQIGSSETVLRWLTCVHCSAGSALQFTTTKAGAYFKLTASSNDCCHAYPHLHFARRTTHAYHCLRRFRLSPRSKKRCCWHGGGCCCP